VAGLAADLGVLGAAGAVAGALVTEAPSIVEHPGAREVRYAMSYAEVIERWQRDPGFVERFVATLTDLPFDAIFWETPPLTQATALQPFTSVAIDAPALAHVAPEADAFGGPFAIAPDGPVATFANLGRDAILVAPRPVPGRSYPHLLAFLRSAPVEHRRALWQAVGDAAGERLSTRPVWVSTAGMGVYWLHVRLDDRPKYYRWAAFTRPA
jgi:hypothetical protein